VRRWFNAKRAAVWKQPGGLNLLLFPAITAASVVISGGLEWIMEAPDEKLAFLSFKAKPQNAAFDSGETGSGSENSCM
jgi:hypothetical protein